MYFTIVCAVSFFWILWGSYLIVQNHEVHPVVYLLAGIAWSLWAVPAAFKVSFGG